MNVIQIALGVAAGVLVALGVVFVFQGLTEGRGDADDIAACIDDNLDRTMAGQEARDCG